MPILAVDSVGQLSRCSIFCILWKAIWVEWVEGRCVGPIGRDGSKLTSLAAIGQLNPFVRLCVLLQLGYNCELARG
jgi:hypothetical protein